MSCVFDIKINVTFDLYIVKSLVIIDFPFVEKTSQMSLTHKITDVPNSQNTFKTQFHQNKIDLICISFKFEFQQENMHIPFCSHLKMWQYYLEKNMCSLMRSLQLDIILHNLCSSNCTL